ncbi:thioredoxin family protein [Patescibacteria group bacterium]|nr:thioredoxin family protein [Patescibacteria group bacterium]MBU1472321.1 thioredoxin family protein [Patescibacteria group bacterium]MBU2460427.1 thioredoxin family protein [Patescibacteria group bacterium]MBU2544246.1 thioredoxin family protein [Patescibacteria group bacterium]
MVLTTSMMLPLGTKAPDFHLTDVVTGETVSPDTFKLKKALLVIFLCRHCPYVKHVQNELAIIGAEHEEKGVGIVAISANDAKEYPDDAPESLAQMVEEAGFTFPVCYDESQAIATAYSAACTPDFFLFDGKRRLAYRGQMDDSRPGNNEPITGADLRAALEAVLAGTPIPPDQKPSSGCNIKWKKDNTPMYFR